jgi:hypothetical protein
MLPIYQVFRTVQLFSFRYPTKKYVRDTQQHPLNGGEANDAPLAPTGSRYRPERHARPTEGKL